MIKSNKSSYGAFAVCIHWLSALAIIILLATGFRAGQTIDVASKATILQLHVTVGGAILLLTLARVVWWLGFDTKPATIHTERTWQSRSAVLVHFLFYIVMIGMVASGIGMLVVSGAAPTIFGAGGELPNFSNYLPRVPHGIGARGMALLLILHAGAALYHHFVKRDRNLKRMWFRS